MCSNIVCECRRIHTLYFNRHFKRDCSSIKISFIETIIEPRSPIKKLLRCLNHYEKTFSSLYSAQNKLYENRAETIRDGQLYVKANFDSSEREFEKEC